MAIFQGEEMVDVTTPDGRTLTLPRSLVPASMLPQVAQGGPPAPMGAPPPPAPVELPGAPFNTANAPISPTTTPQTSAPGVVEEGDPTVQPDALIGINPGIASGAVGGAMKDVEQKQAKQAAADAKKQAAFAKTHEGKLAAVQAQQTAAAGSEADALLTATQLDAATQVVIGDAVAERNKNLDTLIAKRAEEAQKNAEAEDAKLGEVTAMRKKIAGTKIDRKHDSPVMASIGMMLAILGTAMDGRSQADNPAFKAFNEAIDRKVAGQMADLDQMGKVYGMTKEELDALKEKSKSRLEFHNAMIAGETEKAIRHIEEITARSASEKTKANGQIAIAQLQQRVADKTLEATRWGLDFDQKAKQHKEQMGLGYSQIAESRRSSMQNAQITREKNYMDYETALAASKAKGDEVRFKALQDQSKAVRETGIKGLDNNYMLTPQGRAKMDQAAKYETEAQQLEEKYKNDPMGAGVKSTRVQLLRQKASEMRGEANTMDVVQARDTAVAAKVSSQYAAAQTVMDTIDEIKTLYDQAGRGYISRDKLQLQLQTKMGTLTLGLKQAWELGAWDKGLAKKMEEVTGSDPTDGFDVGNVSAKFGLLIGKDPDGFKGRLDAIAQNLDQSVTQQIVKNSNWDGKTPIDPTTGKPIGLFTRKQAPDLNTPLDQASAELSQKRTGVETTDNAYSGGDDVDRARVRTRLSKAGVSDDIVELAVPPRTLTLRDGVRQAFYPASGDIRDEAEAGSSIKHPGLSVDQEAPYEAMIKAYKTGADKRAGDELIGKIANAAQDRPELAIALLHNLQQDAPNLYTAARASLPRDSAADKQMSYEESIKTGPAMSSTDVLTQNVLSTIDKDGKVTDEAGYKELAQRAGKKDPLAQKAILDIVKTSNQRKAPASLQWNGAPRGGN